MLSFCLLISFYFSSVAIIFFLQLLKAEAAVNDIKSKSDYICSRIKEIALKHNVAIVVLSQSSEVVKSGGERKVKVKDFDYDCIISHFDNVSIIICGDDDYDEAEKKGKVEFVMDKNKCGSKGVVYLSWFPGYQRFDNVEMLGRVDGKK